MIFVSLAERLKLKSNVAILGVALTQFIILVIQTPKISGDDILRKNAVIALFNGSFIDIKFSHIQTLVTLPFYKFFEYFGLHNFGVDKFGSICWLIWALVVGIIISRIRGLTYAITLISLAYATLLLPYLNGYNAEATTALGVTGGSALFLLCKSKYAKLLGWTITAISVSNTPVAVFGLIVASFYVVIKSKKLRYLTLPIISMITVVIEASMTKGSISVSKYNAALESGNSPLMPWGTVVGFGHNIIYGVLAIFFSFGRGLIFFIPNFFLSFIRIKDSVGVWMNFMLFFVLSLIPIYAMWWAWYGGITYGPRFFLVACVVGAVATTEIVRQGNNYKLQIVAAVLTLISTIVAFIGVSTFIGPKTAYMCMVNNYIYEPLCWYSLEYSNLFSPAWEGIKMNIQVWALIVYLSFVYLMVMKKVFKELYLTLSLKIFRNRKSIIASLKEYRL